MQYDYLAAYFRSKQREILERVIGSYPGPYSFGIIQAPGMPEDDSCLRLSLPSSESLSNFPTFLDIDGQPVKIVVEGGFETPTAPQKKRGRGRTPKLTD